MLILVSPALSSSVLAFATTVHLALAALRSHRSHLPGPFSFVTLASVLIAGSPWLLPTAAGLALGLLTHATWFMVCERLLPAARRPDAPSTRSAATSAAARPAPLASVVRRAQAKGFVQVPILAVVDEAADVRTFRMARPAGFEFRAGQFLTVKVRADGRDHARCYSISSPPHARGYFEISVKRLGLVSGTLHATLRAGSLLSIRGPAGSFVHSADEDRPVVLIAGGVGITPLVSVLRHVLSAEPARPVTLFYSVRSERDMAFSDELRLLARRHPQFHFVLAITGETTRTDVFPGRIDRALLLAMAPYVSHAECMLCGPPQMIEAIGQVLADIGVGPDLIRREVFNPMVAVTGGKLGGLHEAAHAGEAGPGPAHVARFARSGRAAPASAEQTLLEVAEACGADIPSLCRAGVCGTCRTRVLSGEVECLSQVLDEQDRADGFVLACVSRVRSDCAVDA